MTDLFFLMALLLGGAALLFKQAAEQISVGTSWAGDVCSTSQMFCHHPEYLAYAGGVMLIVAIGAKLGSVAS
ncbi:hypothetical protein [Bradyrhizobium sp.]|jgi:hypothetical protein|uniref:hypothetical protein n=1 Tax=Bradyrhizobium sp. TaxID=376 RepID=UPI003C1454F3